MDIKELLSIYAAHPQINALVSLLERNEMPDILLTGLNGSGGAVTIASLFKQRGGCFLCLMNDLEKAGYFYNDLMQLTGGKHVYFFPSAYHRHIKYGHTDAAAEILRTEVLSMLQEDEPSFIIVSYPDAVAEKVLSKNILQENTLTIHAGEKLDPIFVADVLDTYHFEQTDYVYEPGQYAIRGSIMDIFSFSNEYPYRVDFFGNEVDSIRTFDVETQLSKEKKNEIRIIPEISRYDTANYQLTELLPSGATLVTQDMEWCCEQMGSLWEEEPVNKDDEGFADRETMRRKLIRAEAFMKASTALKQIRFQARPHVTAATLRMDTSPQPLFQKNFERVSESFKQYIADGYTIYLLSDSEKQIERIRAIFEDRGETIAFTAVNRTLHEGFIDHSLRCCFLTDHQIWVLDATRAAEVVDAAQPNVVLVLAHHPDDPAALGEQTPIAGGRTIEEQE